ncbi:glycerol-3-phosphate acyltransferase PlsX [Clostridium tetanomorphum]|uniref:Phosphate acyltransferase n=1 Tax=Clostridium tetanomorphum TaxID=1553 RepID=A0A923EBT8_CLOTT|nr:phosphate acyltransferase PlsX [Clostridium tetanomorphum]KAJ51531.1 phosphate acyltransferase [Clostridium tetanomorphum DSM 665]MBC2398884.1 phosphate acyltransferase PlsX [Clostridium tetanomorphum]MBP1865179.1 glycerol-3-phosphate acyltransferase PlsX [Clostridium tetanomorphum]NRS84682.1 glycerol-3-phosphate acyltransferase PlsX [Clostridium tetanomorphum]NRZ97897.1 glycerol-3-phosphate acyltransferase PlsX [Clostridium tetanomorphum]
MIIAVDGMGGDFAPTEVVAGVIEAIKEYNDLNIIITGPEEIINKELGKYNYDKSKISVVHAADVISTNESPVMAIRRKKDSSLVKALNLVKEKKAHGIISAGSTGAFMAGSLFVIGRIKGIDRPALAPVMPGKNAPFMVIDVGANAECKPKNLVQFALMGKVYFERILNIKNPSIGLVNIGVEEEKGNELTKATYPLLKESGLNFIGNVEPREIPTGDVNVLVCDGFVGNTVLKMYEGTASNLFHIIKSEMISSFSGKIAGLLLKPVFRNIKKKFDYKEYGGAAFLGVEGICVKAHGSSDKKAFKNAVRQCINFHNNNIIGHIKEDLIKINEA